MTKWRKLITPLMFVLVAFVLRFYVVESPDMAAQITRGLAGPATWPDMMLWVIAFFGGVWALQVCWEILKSIKPLGDSNPPYPSPPSDALSTPFSLLIGLGIMLILLYGYFLSILGFATATFVYLISWCVLGGVRKPVLVGSIGLIGTTVLLYLFVKLASMPLDRGEGVMGEFSIMLYRLLGIY